jgi:hypothetical protein
MSMSLVSRRSVLAMPLALFIRGLPPAFAHQQVLKATYIADVGILYDMLTLQLRGSIEEIVDRGAGDYRVIATGAGANIQNRFESSGVLRDGRWKPVRSHSWFDIRGRQSRTDLAYDWSKRRIEYKLAARRSFLDAFA